MSSEHEITSSPTDIAHGHAFVRGSDRHAVGPKQIASKRIRFDDSHQGEPEIRRFPEKLSREEFYEAAYPLMALSRKLEARLLELFQKGYVKGTVTTGAGNEATAVGMAIPLRPKRDVVALLHRDFASHIILGATPYELVCQYMANAESPTHAREGNCHHGKAAERRFPMISHLGKMLSTVVGGTWAARREGEQVVGLAVIGDGGSSTGEFHESINLAAVQNVPVLFLIENNHYSFSTPTSAQYRCRQLSDRAAGFGIAGQTIDGTDPWGVYTAVWDAMAAMQTDLLPQILECMCVRLHGHAAYDKGAYVPDDQMAQWRQLDPLPATRNRLMELCGYSEAAVERLEKAIDEEVQSTVAAALEVARPENPTSPCPVYAPSPAVKVRPFDATNVPCGEAVRQALDGILADNPSAFLAGLDVGTYGSAFKTCKGLIDRHGPERVIDMPLCESATVGFSLGASQVGARPIMEFQFADFSTEVGTQLGLNVATWYFRSGNPAPLLMRLPCGGGLTMGAFHSGEFEGLWSHFPGLKLLYPATPQETYEALLAGYHDPNPCLVFEHKQLYWSRRGDIRFDGDLKRVWRARRYTEGDELTLVAFGATVHDALEAVSQSGRRVEVWNPFVLAPLDIEPIMASVRKTGRLLVVQECGQVQGLGDRVISLVARNERPVLKSPPRLIAAPDTPVPFAPELESYYRPNPKRILAAIRQMLSPRSTAVK